ncbi:MAG: hypothetical protein H6631_16475 [Anaerolineaceae bacterium]|nr:hypothetical protein [Anaerolineaceae bacterium]
MMTISIDFLPQNALGHLDTLTPGIAGCAAAQLPKILRMYEQPPDGYVGISCLIRRITSTEKSSVLTTLGRSRKTSARHLAGDR